MRSIRKAREPAELTRYRLASAQPDYENYPHKDTLRAALVAEQGGLCCYCLSRIPGKKGMKVEHWHSQSEYPLEQLDYSNLLGACMGNEGKHPNEQHCDTRKGKLALSRNPADPGHNVDQLVSFPPDGRISSHDKEFDAELNKVLNLNCEFLKLNRIAVLQGFVEGLQKSGELQRRQLERRLEEWNTVSHTGQLRPYCQVVVYWLRKRLARI